MELPEENLRQLDSGPVHHGIKVELPKGIVRESDLERLLHAFEFELRPVVAQPVGPGRIPQVVELATETHHRV